MTRPASKKIPIRRRFARFPLVAALVGAVMFAAVAVSACPPGQAPGSDSLCYACPVGSYSLLGAPACSVCPAGYSSPPNSVSSDACYALPAAARTACTALATTFKSQQLSAGCYSFAGAANVAANGIIELVGGGDFVFNVNGAMTTGANSVISASSGSVTWNINGALNLGASSVMAGNVAAKGIITLGASSHLLGTATGTVINYGDGATIDGHGPPKSLARTAACTQLPAVSASQTLASGAYCWAGGAAIAAGSHLTLSGSGPFTFTAVGAIVTGASVTVSASEASKVTWNAGGAVTLGALTQLPGDVNAAAAITLGAGANVDGSLLAGAAVTLGASAIVQGNVQSGAGLTLGAHAVIDGNAKHAGALTLGLDADIKGSVSL